MNAKLKVLDLFSGIGGFSLGLEATGGFETVAFCEIDPYCRKVLAKNWPGVPIHEDIKKLTGDQVETIDIITGGFPCQDLSIAGKRAGINGDRSGLWSEIARLVGKIMPKYLFVENVTNLLLGPFDQRGAWFGHVLRDLAALGYDAEWDCIPASYVGLRQLRDRVWLVAYPECQRIQGWQIIASSWQGKSRKKQLARLVQPGIWPTISSARNCGTGHGVPNGAHRNRGIGNAVAPQIPELYGYAILEAEGKMMNCAPDITREEIEKRSVEIHGPKPTE